MTAATRAGRLVRQGTGPEGYSAFIPAPLPPRPPLDFTPELQRLNEAAGRALGRLEGISASFDPERLLYMYVRKEAVLSSAIEGTQSPSPTSCATRATSPPAPRSTTCAR